MSWQKKYHAEFSITADKRAFALQERVKLFEKMVTLSDIKQHRFAIPKSQAKMHFGLHGATNQKGSLLRMEDDEGKIWRFRCIFWKSCQGHVLTSEWNRFVREKGLTAGDTISFLRSTKSHMQLYIEYTPQAERGVLVKNESYERMTTERKFKLFGVTISTNFMQ